MHVKGVHSMHSRQDGISIGSNRTVHTGCDAMCAMQCHLCGIGHNPILVHASSRQHLCLLVKISRIMRFLHCMKRVQKRRHSARVTKRRACTMFIILMCYQLFVADNGEELPKRMWWVHPMNMICGQPGRGEFHSQIQELKLFPDRFYAYFRMHLDKFFNLLNLLKDTISKQNTNWR